MFWRYWRAKQQMLNPQERNSSSTFYNTELCFEELQAINNARAPQLRPYEGLCELWDGFATQWLADYPAYLMYWAKPQVFRRWNVLDLACGTGLLTERLAKIAGEVTGVDCSERMLARARARCQDLDNVTFVNGPFDGFNLGRQFDAAVCSSNSLNYVESADALENVFQTVAEHLVQDGKFVFDALTSEGMVGTSGNYLHATSNGRRFAMKFAYDPSSRCDNTMVILPAGVEFHRQMALDPDDISRAASNSGMVVRDYFSYAGLPGWFHTAAQCFYLLEKP